MLIILPIPSSKLSANQTKGKHWSAIYRLQLQAKHVGYYSTLEWLNKNKNIDLFDNKCQMKCEIKVYYQNKNHLDDDNLLSAFKSTRDGIFECLNKKYGCNDRQITLTILDAGSFDKIYPRLEYGLFRRN